MRFRVTSCGDRAHSVAIAMRSLVVILRLWWRMDCVERWVLWALDEATPPHLRRRVDRAIIRGMRRGWINGMGLPQIRRDR